MNIQFIVQNIFPTLSCLQAHWKLRKVYQKREQTLSKCKIHITKTSTQADAAINADLERIFTDELRRRDKIETKAGSIFSSNAVTIPLLIVTYQIIHHESGNCSLFIKTSLICASLYLFFSTLNAIIAQRISAVHKPSITEFEHLIDRDLFVLKPLNSKEKIRSFYCSTKLNMVSTAVKANYVYASQIDLRNGILLAVLALLALIFQNN